MRHHSSCMFDNASSIWIILDNALGLRIRVVYLDSMREPDLCVEAGAQELRC